MAVFTNVTGSKLIVTDELGLPITFEAGEQKAGLSNYLNQYTSTYKSGEDILLRLDSDLDNADDLFGADLPSAVIEEENMAVRPAAPNSATQGVRSTPGGVRGATTTEQVVAAGFSDTANSSTRLKRIGLNTEQDTEKRQVDTRYLGVKPAKAIAVNDTESFASADFSANPRNFTMTAPNTSGGPPIESNGRKATADDAANSIYGSLLTEGNYYTAWGFGVATDDGSGDTLTFGFSIRHNGTSEVVTTTSQLAAAWDGGVQRFTFSGAFVPSTGVLGWTAAGGFAAADEISTTIYYAAAIDDATVANAVYGPSSTVFGVAGTAPEVRGTYEVNARTSTAGILTFTEEGIFELKAGGNAFVAFS